MFQLLHVLSSKKATRNEKKKVCEVKVYSV